MYRDCAQQAQPTMVAAGAAGGRQGGAAAAAGGKSVTIAMGGASKAGKGMLMGRRILL